MINEAGWKLRAVNTDNEERGRNQQGFKQTFHYADQN